MVVASKGGPRRQPGRRPLRVLPRRVQQHQLHSPGQGLRDLGLIPKVPESMVPHRSRASKILDFLVPHRSRASKRSKMPSARLVGGSAWGGMVQGFITSNLVRLLSQACSTSSNLSTRNAIAIIPILLPRLFYFWGEKLGFHLQDQAQSAPHAGSEILRAEV